MAFTPGTRIGAFEISAHIGTGGMGEVYRARDTRLGRDVAIKVLPDTLSRNRTRLTRFEREAQVLASVNHPNIATIYGIERDPEDEGLVRAIVMELVPGDTLADRLLAAPQGRGLPLDDTLHIARQIVSALDTAHERGIVHRDLKPANIKVRPDGTVKVLDFGLAKMESTPLATAGIETETLASVATRDGAILGSPGYMSPEQARGQVVDARADIWAFGCVLFEMASGRPPFMGTVIEVIAAALTREPDWDALPVDTPESLRRLMRRCLQHDARRRLRAIADASFELDEAVAPSVPSSTAATTPKSIAFQRLTDRLGLNESPAISPDGRMVAFVAPVAGERRIWVRLLSGGAPLQLTHEGGHHEQPRWTPDGSAVVYFAVSATEGESGTLMEISALGGTPRPLVSCLSGGDVSHDGRRIATFRERDDSTDLVTISRQNGSVECVCAGPPGVACRSPRWSPDDRWIAFHSRAIHQFDEQLRVVSAGGGEASVIASAAAFKGLSWLPDSHGLVYSSSDGSTVHYPATHNLRRVGRDGRNDRAITCGDLSYVEPDVDATGRIVAARIRSQSDIWKFPITGSPSENVRAAVRITGQSGQVQTPSVSPDGTAVAYLSDNGGHANVWVARTDGGGAARQITFEHDSAVTIGLPLWSPVDNRIAFVQGRGGLGVWIVNADGSGRRQLISGGGAPCWSPDGAWMYYTVFGGGDLQIQKIPSQGGRSVVVRSDRNSHGACAGTTALYYAVRTNSTSIELGDWEIRRASPEDGPSDVIAHVAGSRLPVSSLFVSTILSRDGRWLALPLIDGYKSSIGVVPASGGSFTSVLDFGERPTIIARQVSWSPDGSIYAAVAEISEDIVLLDGLI